MNDARFDDRIARGETARFDGLLARGETARFDAAVIGAGFGGIAMCIALRELGLRFVWLERASDVGGTWRDNHYPGAACDVPASLYSFSFAPHAWTRRFPGQREILDYARWLVKRYDLSPRLNSAVRTLRFDEQSAHWNIGLAGGETLHARFVISAVGQLSEPFIPELPGKFRGESVHTARWRDISLQDKTVAVIGTGASAIQVVPQVAREARRVLVFQRSAPFVLPKPDRAYGWLEARALSIAPSLLKPERMRVFVLGELLASALTAPGPQALAFRTWWQLHMRSQLRGRADLVAACTPHERFGCKRVLFADDWYPTLRRSNVTLVNDEIKGLHASGVDTRSGRSFAADVLVYATGFRATEFLSRIDVFGRGGRSLKDLWRHGAHAFHGVSVNGFPNLFLLYGPNTNVGSTSILYMLEAQVGYVRAALERARSRRHGWLEVRADAARKYADWIASRSHRTAWESGCHSWYTVEGKNTNNWPALAFQYARELREFDARNYSHGS